MFQGWGGLIPNKLTKAPDCRETAKDDFGVSEVGPRKDSVRKSWGQRPTSEDLRSRRVKSIFLNHFVKTM